MKLLTTTADDITDNLQYDFIELTAYAFTSYTYQSIIICIFFRLQFTIEYLGIGFYTRSLTSQNHLTYRQKLCTVMKQNSTLACNSSYV